jgi:hypothetical protein
MAKTAKDVIKFTDAERDTIQQFNGRVNEVYLRLGQLRIQAEGISAQLAENEKQLIEEFNSVNTERNDFFKTLYDKYGDGNYDPNTGEFTPTKKD